ncbi:MAG: tetratricopeptide repeat protein [Oscillospiraceae bacterium]|nr:tetratricopeptide repeat protein [Oscillospiraceae bacterium]
MQDTYSPPLSPSDYLEPACLLCGDEFGAAEHYRPVPMDRVRAKLDELEGRRDFAGAERQLRYWLDEARLGRDTRGTFALENELMGFCRKQGRREDAYRAAEAALALIGPLGLEGSVTAATCYVNSATVYDAFGEPERALPLFERARAIYERELPADDPRLGGLYNNMGLALAACKRWDEARENYRRALEIMAKTPGGELEQAVTWLNVADALFSRRGAEDAEAEIADCLDKAAALLDSTAPARDGYYAFVCEKCAPGFDFYGWFAYAAELRERAEVIYAGA